MEPVRDNGPDPHQTCRACLCPIDSYEAPLSDIVVSTLFKDCTALQYTPNDKLPQNLCHQCHSFCITWSNFKDLCEKNDHLLKELLSKRPEKRKKNCKTISKIPIFIQPATYDPFLNNESFYDDYCLVCHVCRMSYPAISFFQHICLIPMPETTLLSIKDEDIQNMEQCELNGIDFLNEDEDDDSVVGVSNEDEDVSDNECKIGDKPISIHLESNKARYPCKKCGVKFRRPIILRKHELSHIVVKEPRCVKCNATFLNYILLEEHGQTEHTLEILKHYSCLYCPQTFATYAILIKHMYTHEQALEILPNNKYQCPKCDDYKPTQKSLQKHVQKCVPFSHTCTVCGDVAKNSTLLKTHMKIHTNKGKEFLCTTCGKVYKSRPALRNHFATHTGRQDKCEICHRVFSSPVRLNVHKLRSHSNKKRIPCNLCTSDFRDNYSLRAHMEAEHEEKPFKCCICGQGFKFKMSLAKHESKCYPGKIVKPSKKKIPDPERIRCPMQSCAEGFPTLPIFRKHLEDAHKSAGIDIEAVFNSIKVFHCSECDKRFATQKNLQAHRSIHSGHKPYACEVCNKAFISSTLLTYHMLTHKKEKPISTQQHFIAIQPKQQ